MPRNRKFHPAKSVLFITTSLEEGLLLKSNPLMRAILESCLAKAQRITKVRICHFLFEENHVHLIIVVDDPEMISDFMGRFKTESAHAINRLLGRRKRTVWCEGYDSPILGYPVDVIKYMVYLYTNPVKDNLAESINQYPGLTSWNAFNLGETKIQCIPFKRPDVPKLSSLSPSEKELEFHLEGLKESYPETIELELQPNAWMEIMNVDISEGDEINSRVFDIVARKEIQYAKKRAVEQKGVVGPEGLKKSSISLTHRSKRNGKRTYIISSKKSLVVHVIQTVKALIEEGKTIYQRWREGDTSARYPIGIYPPSMPRMGNLIPGVVV